MSAHPRSLSRLTGVAFCLIVGLAQTACHRRAPSPVPFSGGLTEVDGVQAVLSLRHPKLVNQDLEKFITAVPEAAMMRVGLAGLTAYGFPEFSEIAAGSNIGVVMLRQSAGDLKGKSPDFIGLAKMKEGGKLQGLLSKGRFAFQKHGEWMFIAKDPGEFAKIKDPEAIIAYLERPQAVDVRVWIRNSPEFLAHLREKFTSSLGSELAAYPPDKRKASLAYFDVVVDLLKQLHSVDVTLAFAENEIRLAYSVQFLPETPFGRYFRFQPGPPPGVAKLVSRQALATAAFRADPKALQALADSVLDSLISVDYPPLAKSWTKWKSAYDAFAALNDGGGAAVFDLTVTDQDRIRLKPRFFYANSGRFDPEIARNYFKSTQSLSHIFSLGMLRSIPLAPGVPRLESHSEYSEKALTVDGIPFDRLRFSNQIKGQTSPEITEYLGVADGNLVMADGEDTLKERLPALRAKVELPDGIPFPDSPDLLGEVSLDGARLVDILAAAGKLDLRDPDTQAQIGGLKASFSAAGPILTVITGGQAKAAATISVPYKFIESAIHLVIYGKARSIDLFKLMAPSARVGNPPPGLPTGGPPARADQALRDRRAKAAEEIAARPRDFNALADLVAIDRALKESAQSLAFYDHLPADSPSRAIMTRLLYAPFIEAKRYPEALRALPYARFRMEMARYRQMNWSAGGNPTLANAQASILAMRAGSEAEAFAGVGDIARARQIVGDILKSDRSPKTISVLREHLARAGHGELVDLELKSQ